MERKNILYYIKNEISDGLPHYNNFHGGRLIEARVVTVWSQMKIPHWLWFSLSEATSSLLNMFYTNQQLKGSYLQK